MQGRNVLRVALQQQPTVGKWHGIQERGKTRKCGRDADADGCVLRQARVNCFESEIPDGRVTVFVCVRDVGAELQQNVDG